MDGKGSSPHDHGAIGSGERWQQRTGEFASSPLDDGIVLLHLDDGRFYYLGETAGDIWRLLEEPRTIGEIGEELTSTYAIAPEQCQASVGAFIEELAARRIVERLEQPSAS